MADEVRIDDADSVGWTRWTADGHFGVHQVVAMARVIMDLRARVEAMEADRTDVADLTDDQVEAEMRRRGLDVGPAWARVKAAMTELTGRLQGLEAEGRGCTCRDPKSPDEAPCDYCTREPEPEGRPCRKTST